MNGSTSGTDGVCEPQSGVVRTRADRDLAAVQWLVAASEERVTADEWVATGFTVLRCGGLFTTVGLPEKYVHAAARTELPERVAIFLREHVGGPVFFDSPSRRYHALVPPSAALAGGARARHRVRPRGGARHRPGARGSPGGQWPRALGCAHGRPGVACSPQDVALVTLTGHSWSVRVGVGS